MGRRPHDEYWSLVTKIGKSSWKCNLCGVQFAGGVSRIKAHVDRIPGKGISVCSVGRDGIASCSTGPQQAANIMNSVDGDQEMIDANTSLIAHHINTTETTSLFEVPGDLEMIDATVSGFMVHQHNIESFTSLEEAADGGHETVDTTINDSMAHQNNIQPTNFLAANGGYGMIGVTINGSIPAQNNTASTDMLGGESPDTRMKINTSSTKSATRLLKQVLGELVSEEDDINGQLKLLESQGKKRNRRVDTWLNKVQGLKKKAGHMNYTVDQFGCLHAPDILQLAEDMRSHQNQKPLVLSNEFVGENFEKNVKKMWKLLEDDQVFVIGIYGMGGVGKTCLVTYMANEIKRKGSFDHVFGVTVSHEFTISKLQHDIAEQIGAKLDRNDEGKGALSLSSALEAKGKSVLILKDVWKNIDLQRVGVPLNVSGIKLILTSRLKHVCQEMNCPPKNIIEVCPLSEEEGKELFLLKLGYNGTPAKLDDEAAEVAKSIALQCNGLPLGINVMAGLGSSDMPWWNELENLEIEEEMEEEVLKVLKLSYDNLVDKNLQDCFLHSALYDDYNIERSDLIIKFVDNKLINGMRTLQEIFDEGRIILDKLKDHSLLISDDPLKMHGLVRNMARRVIKVNHKYVVKCDEELTERHFLQEWTTDLEVVSLMRTWDKALEIPAGTSPRCPRLSTLILSQSFFRCIPECFLRHMNALTVLDLSFNDMLTSLPDSLSKLRSLTSLVLEGCSELEYVPPLGELKALSRLDLSGTSIKEVQGLEELINLKWLDLSFSHLKLIPGSVLPGLTNMQFLDLRVPFGSIEVKEKDLETMSMLERFGGIFEHGQSYNNFVQKNEVNRFGRKTYHLHSGTWPNMEIHEEDRLSGVLISPDNVGFRIVSFGDCEDDLTHLLPTDLARLYIWENAHWIRLCDALSSNGPTSLSRIEIAACTELKSLFCAVASCRLCSNLQELEACLLCDLGSLTVICKEDDGSTAPSLPSPNGVFSRLKELYILGCHEIEKLLTPGLLPQLQNLETLHVIRCFSVTEIFAVSNSGDDDDVSIALPKLTELTLRYLPQLKIVCQAPLVFGSVPTIDIIGCPKLERFPITVTRAVDFDSSDSD